MDLQLGFKVTRAADEFTSTEFQFAKDRAGPLFQSAETATVFILTAHLKGYTRENIKIDINEEGTKMVIIGEKPVQETVMVGWKVIKKDVEITKFTKAFKIPDGVILDKIKTKFDEIDSVLTITMPKRVKGILGIGIEEMKEPELLTRADKVPKRVTFQEDKREESSAEHDSVSTYRKEDKLENGKETPRKPSEDKNKTLADRWSRETEMQLPSSSSTTGKAHEGIEKHAVDGELDPRVETEMPKVEQKMDEKGSHCDKIGDDKPECTNLKGQLKDDKVCEKANGIQEEKEEMPESRFKISVPVVAGSAVILSFVVFVIHFMRMKSQTEKRKG